MDPQTNAPKILIVSNTAFLPAVQGDSRRLYGLISGLRAQGIVVGVLNMHDNEQQDADYSTMRMHCDFLDVYQPALCEVARCNRGLDSQCSDSFLRRFRNVVREFSPDIVLAQFAYMSRCLSELDALPNVLKILDADNIFYLRQTRFAGAGVHENWVQTTAEEEIEAWRRADVLLGIQPKECCEMASHVPNIPVLLIYPSTPLLRLNISNLRTLLFVGANNPANAKGLKRFAAEALPLLEAALGEVRLDVVGSICTSLSDSVGKSVHLHGVQSDIVRYYKQAAIALNLVEASSGINMKLVEALGYGRCVVSTPGGAHAIHGLTDAVITADHGVSMATEIIKLLNDEKRLLRLSRSAHKFASTHFSEATAISPLVEIVLRWTSNRSRDELKRFRSTY
jgi:glycosyltransferase involved in cell wall biosynthesis